MTTATKFQIRSNNGVIDTHNSIVDAVLAAAGHDGWGARFLRDDEGLMRLFSSFGHIGNNDYIPNLDRDGWRKASSVMIDDDAAIADVANQIYFGSDALHSRYDLEIVTLNYINDELTMVDGKPVSEIAEDMDISVEDVCGIYQ